MEDIRKDITSGGSVGQGEEGTAISAYFWWWGIDVSRYFSLLGIDVSAYFVLLELM